MAFDVVLGSEIIYEDEHADWISDCVRAFLRPGGAAYFIGSTVPERPGWAQLKSSLQSAVEKTDTGIFSLFRTEITSVQHSDGVIDGLPDEIWRGYNRKFGADCRHEMISAIRIDRVSSASEFPTIMETTTGNV